MAVKDFDADMPGPADPIEFKLFGKRWHCVGDVNGKRMMDNVALLDSDVVAELRDGVLALFEDAIDSSEIEEFMEILEDPKTIVPLGKLAEIAGWLAEQYMSEDRNRPTEQREQSGTGRATAGRTSTAKRAARASTSARSRQPTS